MEKPDELYRISRKYGFVRARELEGTLDLSPSIGVFLVSTMRVQKGWGMLPEKYWPSDYSKSGWPPNDEPRGIDEIAKKFRLEFYERLLIKEELMIVLRNGGIPLVTLDIDKSHWTYAKDGIIAMPTNEHELTDIHCVAITGFDDDTSSFKFVNNWGEKWGKDGYGSLSYEYVDRYMNEAFTAQPLFSPGLSFEGNRFIYKLFKGQSGRLMSSFEFFDQDKNEIIGWSFCTHSSDHLEIEEFFIRPDYQHRGFGTQLTKRILHVSKKINLPIRLWVSKADIERDNFYVVEKIAKRLKVKLQESSSRWAAYLGIP